MSYPEPPNGPPYPPLRDPRDYQDSQYPPPPSEYPPPPGEEDDRRAYNARMAQGMPSQSNVTLPSISSPYDPQYAPPPPNGYTPDPRYRQNEHYPIPPQGYVPPPRGYPAEYQRGGPAHMQFATSAPRQRTAIACRYCRRRKIRCSGFEDNPSGKCQNCTRFQQECIFTPVSSQAQAFVPVHAAYPHMNRLGPDGRPQYYPPQQLYGAHGQPLGPMPTHGGPPPPPPPPPPQGYEYGAPSPTAPYYPADQRVEIGRKRPFEDPQPPLLPHPQPEKYPRSDSSRRAEDDIIDRRLPPMPVAAPAVAHPPVTPVVAQATSNYSPQSSASKAARLGSEPLPPPRVSPPKGARDSPARADPMALGNIIGRPDAAEIDRNMLGRLNRK